jgi:hypothetical protein
MKVLIRRLFLALLVVNILATSFLMHENTRLQDQLAFNSLRLDELTAGVQYGITVLHNRTVLLKQRADEMEEALIALHKEELEEM